MIKVKVESIRVSLINQNRLVVLRELEGLRYLAIWIGPFEAEAITIGLKGTEIDRPLTHDLLRGAIEQLDAQIDSVMINHLQEDTFFARIVLTREGTEEALEIDARPSDAIALAVRADVAIYVAESVMDTAGQTPSEEEEGAAVTSVKDKAEVDEAEDAVGLDLFRDFFDGLEIGEEGAPDADESSSEDESPSEEEEPDAGD